MTMLVQGTTTTNEHYPSHSLSCNSSLSKKATAYLIPNNNQNLACRSTSPTYDCLAATDDSSVSSASSSPSIVAEVVTTVVAPSCRGSNRSIARAEDRTGLSKKIDDKNPYQKANLKDLLVLRPTEDRIRMSSSVTKPPQPTATSVSKRITSSSLRSSLKSSLRTGSFLNGSNTKKKKATRNCRKVRGLWDEGTDCLFAELKDDTVLHIFSFLNMYDLTTRCAPVSKRWNYLSNREPLWSHVDATEFVHKTYAYFCRQQQHQQQTQLQPQPQPPQKKKSNPADQTTKALVRKLDDHEPLKLTIRSIDRRLSPHSFAPSLSRIQELELTGFQDLTDTHVHVMLLLALAPPKQKRNQKQLKQYQKQSLNKGQHNALLLARRQDHTLRKLVLDHCPLLSNTSLQTISQHCTQLEELSMRGCTNVDDLTSLNKCWKVKWSTPSHLVPPVLDQRSSSSNRQPLVAKKAAIPTSTGGFNSFSTNPQDSLTSSQPKSVGGLASLFASPQKGKKPAASSLFSAPSPSGGMASLFSAPTTAPSTTSNGLSSLFSAPAPAPKLSDLSSLFSAPVPAPASKATNSGGLASLFSAPVPAPKATSQGTNNLTSLFATASSASKHSPSAKSNSRPILFSTASKPSGQDTSAGKLSSLFAPPASLEVSDDYSTQKRDVANIPSSTLATSSSTTSKQAGSLSGLFSAPPSAPKATVTISTAKQSSSLSGLFSTPATPITTTTLSLKSTTNNSLGTMFSPPNKTETDTKTSESSSCPIERKGSNSSLPKPQSSVKTPSVTPISTSAVSEGFASLFAPPGTSPLRPKPIVLPRRSSSISISGDNVGGGKLTRCDFSYTGVTADKLIHSFSSAIASYSEDTSNTTPEEVMLSIESIRLLQQAGGGESSSLQCVQQQLGHFVDMKDLCILDIIDGTNSNNHNTA